MQFGMKTIDLDAVQLRVYAQRIIPDKTSQLGSVQIDRLDAALHIQGLAAPSMPHWAAASNRGPH